MADDYFASIKDGIRGLGENLQQLGFMNALSSANDRVRELKGTVKNDVELRQKVYDVADQMSQYMLSNGMDAAKIESVVRSLGAPQFKTPQEQAIYSAQRGDEAGLAQSASADIAGSAGEAKISAANNATQIKLQGMKEAGDNYRAGVAGSNKPPTAEQSKAANFAAQMKMSESTFKELEVGGFNKAAMGTTLQKKLPNRFQSSDLQRQSAAEQTFLNASLRRDSGAAINEGEWKVGRERFFPQDGDSKEVIIQKRKNRILIMKALDVEGGAATQLLERALGPDNLDAWTPKKQSGGASGTWQKYVK